MPALFACAGCKGSGPTCSAMITRFSAPPPMLFIDALAALQARAYAQTGMRGWSSAEIVSLVAVPANRLLVAQDDSGCPLGFVLASVLETEIEILVIAVDPAHHRRGIASELLASLEQDDARVGIERIILEVAENNHHAIFLYNSLRFYDVGVRRNYYDIGGVRIDARVMEKRFFSG